MFENLSQREKILALLVGSLVPLALLVMTVSWFFGQQSKRSTEINSLRTQIKTEKQRVTEAINANQRRLYYRSVSLPSKFQEASNKYQQWLKALVRDEVGMTFKSINTKLPRRLKFEGEVIGRTEAFDLRAETDLEQLVEFLTKFNQLDLLHRINSIKLTPKAAGTSGQRANIRTGKLVLAAQIEVLSLVDADAERKGFLERFRKLELTAEDYQDAILKRNIFGPANNTPTLTFSKTTKYYSNKDLSITINAKDADKNQKLTFSILDPPIESAKLEQKKPTDRRAYLKAPKQPAGEYTFKVQVADDGYPPKSSEIEIPIVVNKPKPTGKTKTKTTPPPKFKHIRETRITAIVKDKSGDWEVWINVRTKGEKHKLKEGDSFTLDGKKWKVTSIDLNEATFSVDGTAKTFGRNQPFDGSEKTASLGR